MIGTEKKKKRLLVILVGFVPAELDAGSTMMPWQPPHPSLPVALPFQHNRSRPRMQNPPEMARSPTHDRQQHVVQQQGHEHHRQHQPPRRPALCQPAPGRGDGTQGHRWGARSSGSLPVLRAGGVPTPL